MRWRGRGGGERGGAGGAFPGPASGLASNVAQLSLAGRGLSLAAEDRMNHPATILVVDEDPAVRQWVPRVLGTGWRVLTAPAAEEALELLDRQAVPILLA